MTNRRRYIGISAASAGLLLGAWFLPYTPLRSWPVASSFVSVDAAVAIALLVAAVILAAFGSSSPTRRPLIFASLLAILLCGLYGGRNLAQGIGDGSPPPMDHALAFISWNSGEVDTDSVADQISPMVRDLDADIVVLPEVGWVTGERVGDLLSSSGFPNKTFAPESATTSVILSTALSDSGGYTIDSDAPPWAGVVLRPETVSADTPVIVGVHLQQPGITSADTWQMHLQWIRDLCEGDEYIVIIGDFNTTINSMGGSTLGSCTDVASMHGAGAGATWPTILPPIMGVAIDRFLVGRAYSPAEATMHIQRSVTGSDHWAITGSIPALSD